MHTSIKFETKKELEAAIKQGAKISVYQPGYGKVKQGIIDIEGVGRVLVSKGNIVKVK